MSHDRLVLIEHLGAPGAAEADARTRASILQQSGFDVAALLADPSVCGAPTLPGRPGARLPRYGADRAGIAALRERIAAWMPTRVVIASPQAGGGPWAAAVPAGATAHWWPTGLGEASAAGALAPLCDPAGEAPLDWSVPDPVRGGRSRLPLWDGDHVLAPLPLAGRAGHAALEAFAEAAEDAYDLVVLADPQPEFEAKARALGIGIRVHFAGPAPREAEHAWWASASAALVVGGAGASAGLVWRALAGGCPLIVSGEDPTTALLRGWLERHHASSGPRAGESLGAALARVLEHDPASRLACERGRALARAQWGALVARAGRALGAGVRGVERRAA